jgi:hypothetical protein
LSTIQPADKTAHYSANGTAHPSSEF